MSVRNSFVGMDSTNPYKPTTTEDMEDDDDIVDSPQARTSRLFLILGGFCMLMAVMQEAFYIMVISVSASEPHIEEHALPEMSTASAMAGITAMYVALTARLLYLVLSRNRIPEVVTARRWCWIVSAVLIFTHILLCIWFGLNEDYAPLGMYLVTSCIYTIFCVVIKTHINISDHTKAKSESDVKSSPESQPSLKNNEEEIA